MSLIDVLSLAAPLICLIILIVKDNVYAASILIPASLVVALVALLTDFTFLALLVLLVYIGVVIVLIIVAASAIEQAREQAHVRKVLPLIAVSLMFPLLMRGHLVMTGVSANLEAVTMKWMPVIIVLIISMLVIVLTALNISRRGLTQ